MKLFSIMALAVPASVVVAMEAPVVANDAVAHYNDISKRIACNINDWISGLQAIVASMNLLTDAILANQPNYPPCQKVANLGAIVQCADNLSLRINQEAAAVGQCVGGNQPCAQVHIEVLQNVAPKASIISKIVSIRSAQIKCNGLGNLVTTKALGISGAMVAYGNSFKKQMAAACSGTVSGDVDLIRTYITQMLYQIQ